MLLDRTVTTLTREDKMLRFTLRSGQIVVMATPSNQDVKAWEVVYRFWGESIRIEEFPRDYCNQ
jgi:hypothetical protein